MANHTDLKGGIITATETAETAGRNRFQTASISHGDIENHSRYEGDGFGIGVSGSISGQSLGQTAPTADSRIQTVAGKNGIDSSIGYGSDGGSQSSVTKSGIGTRNIIIGNDTDGTQAAAAYTATRSETAEQNSGRLNNIFDKERVQSEIDLQRKVSQEFSKNVQEARTEINRKAEGYKALAKAAEDKAAQALQNGDLNAYREAVQTANEHHQKADNWQKGGVALAAVATGLSAPTDSALGIAAATASPAAAYQIGQYFKELAQQNSDGKLTAKQETAHILAHTVLGAATAAAGDNNALAGAISAGSAEAAAPLIGNYLYGEKDGSKLTAEQKETVTAITSLLGAATGATVGNSATNAAQGSLNADSAVENNSILSRTARTRLNPQSKVLYDRIIQKGNFHTVEDFNHAYAQCPNKACQNAVVQAFQKERERFFTYLADEIKDGKQRELLIKEFAPVMSGENSLLGGRFGQAAAINWSGYQDGFLARFPDAWIEKDKIAQKTASGMSLEQAERSAMKEMLIPQAISAALVGAVGSKINPAYKAAKQTDGSHAKPKEPSTVDGEMAGGNKPIKLPSNVNFQLLERALQHSIPTKGHPNQLIYTLDDGTRLIFRKDFGDKAHPIGNIFQGKGAIDHYNIEVQIPRANGSVRTIENLHIVPNSLGGFTWWGKDGVTKK
ncbi:VENN motif pre-toxin domain-containing protein [Neisseria yangbaofengii]|uniref:VENN motif pre-toxin domain-containing protein n=2 Tax=Neisseria yangbaofengii TaxID=2709396 RepID=UPI003B9E97AA